MQPRAQDSQKKGARLSKTKRKVEALIADLIKEPNHINLFRFTQRTQRLAHKLRYKAWFQTQ